MADDLAKKILQRFGDIRSMKQVWNGHYQDVKELVRCDTTDFNRKVVPGYRLYDGVYDGTAINANEELASGLNSSLTNPSDQWFELGCESGPLTKLTTYGTYLRVDSGDAKELISDSVNGDPASLAWLELVSDIIYGAYSRPDSNFNPSIHESYLDLGSFGTQVLNQEWSYETGNVLFKNFPLAQCYFMESNTGQIDTVWREFEWTGRQVMQEFGDSVPPKMSEAITRTKGEDRMFKILHHICPRKDQKYGLVGAKNMKFASYYVAMDTSETITESGYTSLPYHVSRWVKLSGETYGRGPAMKCLPDIKVLNAMEKVLLKAGQKAVDPPMVVPDDGFMLPIKTSPGSINFKESTNPDLRIEFLEFKGDVKFGLEQSQQKRDYIMKCFYSEWLKMEKENKEMTAFEVADRRDEKLRMMAPMLGRQQTELLGPMIARTYGLLSRMGQIPPAPPALQKKNLKIIYISPAARAQHGVKGQRVSQFMQDMIPIAQLDQSVMDAVDMDKLTQIYAGIRGVPRVVLRSQKDIMAIRQQRQKVQAMQQAAAVAEPASNAVKNIAQARQAGQSPQ